MLTMSDQIAMVEALAKEDQQFRNGYIAAVQARDLNVLQAFLASRGFEGAAEAIKAQTTYASELDESELLAVAGGKTGLEKIDEYCSEAGAFLCGVGIGVALWSPDYRGD